MINLSQGGAISNKVGDCSDCKDGLTDQQRLAKDLVGIELERHNVSRLVPLDSYFSPANLTHQKAAIRCVEVDGVYPIGAGNEIWMSKVTPEKFSTYLYITPLECEKIYGVPDATNAGFTFDVVSQAFNLLGAPVGAATVHMPAVVASTLVTKGVALSPATGGIDSGDNYLMFGIKPITNPTGNSLSQIQCGFRLTPHAIGD